MNILFVYPKYPDTFWSFKHALKFVSKKAPFPPLGLLTVASLLPKKWNKKLIDVNVTELKDEHIDWADLVFISSMLVQKESTRDIIARCKSKNKKIVAGGPLFTTQYDDFDDVDHLVLNEAEVTLKEFLKDLSNGNPKHIYTSEMRPDVTKTPIPSWNLINFKDYATMCVQYSRGCPYNCEFCDIVIMNGRVPRAKTPRQLLLELETLYDKGWRGGLFIVDDNFIGNKKNVKEMLKLLVKWQKKHKHPFKLLTEASIDLSDDDELMRLMSAANFNKVFLGIETPNDNSLKECNKIQNIKRDFSESVKTIQKHGMQVMGGFIVGFDNDTDKIFDTQIKFIQEIGVVTAMVGMLNVLPQTRLWHRLKAENRLLAETTGENTDGSVNFVPKMGREKLIEGYKSILSTIYKPKYYYKRVSIFMKSYKPTVKSKITKDDMRAFFMSIWNIGILSKSRFHYWKLMAKTFFTKIKALPIAVELAIYGLHFERIAKRVTC